jgi:hypothetical protein
MSGVLGILSITLVIDPYGVSPIKLLMPGINSIKPARVNIDRQLKPYEVWVKRPRTIFLGTSRIHQSINPERLQGSNSAPAYNASIPAGNLATNISNIEQYALLNPQLKTVIVEVFMWNFLGQGQERIQKGLLEMIQEAAPLFFSSQTISAAWKTLFHNIVSGAEVYEITPSGYFHYPPGHQPAGTFAGFAAGIWKMHPGAKLKLNEAAFETLAELVGTAEKLGIEVILWITPNHAYSDWFLDHIGAWPLVEEWLKRVTSIAPAYSFSQVNALTHESVSNDMIYWYDPFHFSLLMGNQMIDAFFYKRQPEDTDNFMARLTEADIKKHVEVRRLGIKLWAKSNQDFTNLLQEEQGKALQNK